MIKKLVNYAMGLYIIENNNLFIYYFILSTMSFDKDDFLSRISVLEQTITDLEELPDLKEIPTDGNALAHSMAEFSLRDKKQFQPIYTIGTIDNKLIYSTHRFENTVLTNIQEIDISLISLYRKSK